MRTEITFKCIKLNSTSQIFKSIALISCFVVSSYGVSQQKNKDIEPEIMGADVIDLSNGDLSDLWKPFSSHWSFKEGVFIGNTNGKKLKEPEWVYTKQKFGDFEFTCEMKLTGDIHRNTGVYFRVNEIIFKSKKGNKSYLAASGYEFDMVYHNPGKKNFRGSLGDWYARPAFRVFPNEKIINKVYITEKWNRLTIRANENRIEFWLNGIKIIDFLDRDSSASVKGTIGFQIHDGTAMKVEYRNIRIGRLDVK